MPQPQSVMDRRERALRAYFRTAPHLSRPNPVDQESRTVTTEHGLGYDADAAKETLSELGYSFPVTTLEALENLYRFLEAAFASEPDSDFPAHAGVGLITVQNLISLAEGAGDDASSARSVRDHAARLLRLLVVSASHAVAAGPFAPLSPVLLSLPYQHPPLPPTGETITGASAVDEAVAAGDGDTRQQPQRAVGAGDRQAREDVVRGEVPLDEADRGRSRSRSIIRSRSPSPSAENNDGGLIFGSFGTGLASDDDGDDNPGEHTGVAMIRVLPGSNSGSALHGPADDSDDGLDELRRPESDSESDSEASDTGADEDEAKHAPIVSPHSPMPPAQAADDLHGDDARGWWRLVGRALPLLQLWQRPLLLLPPSLASQSVPTAQEGGCTVCKDDVAALNVAAEALAGAAAAAAAASAVALVVIASPAAATAAAAAAAEITTAAAAAQYVTTAAEGVVTASSSITSAASAPVSAPAPAPTPAPAPAPAPAPVRAPAPVARSGADSLRSRGDKSRSKNNNDDDDEGDYFS